MDKICYSVIGGADKVQWNKETVRIVTLRHPQGIVPQN